MEELIELCYPMMSTIKDSVLGLCVVVQVVVLPSVAGCEYSVPHLVRASYGVGKVSKTIPKGTKRYGPVAPLPVVRYVQTSLS